MSSACRMGEVKVGEVSGHGQMDCVTAEDQHVSSSGEREREREPARCLVSSLLIWSRLVCSSPICICICICLCMSMSMRGDALRCHLADRNPACTSFPLGNRICISMKIAPSICLLPRSRSVCPTAMGRAGPGQPCYSRHPLSALSERKERSDRLGVSSRLGSASLARLSFLVSSLLFSCPDALLFLDEC